MVLGWRRAFCTSTEPKGSKENPSPSPRLSSRFGFFSSSSNPSTPRLQSQPVSSPSLRCRTVSTAPDNSPKLQCKTTTKSPRFFYRSSNPSSPRSPSAFSILKSSLRLSRVRCGICLHSMKSGQGTAIFTAECSHGFHFLCIADRISKRGSLACPICGSDWKELPVLTTNNNNTSNNNSFDFKPEEDNNNLVKKRSVFKVYNDDEPLMSPGSVSRFNPIPESDENEDNSEEFQGFYANNNDPKMVSSGRNDVEITLSPEAAVVSVGRNHETYAVVMRVRAPSCPNKSCRSPIDLVTVLDVSCGLSAEKMNNMKRAMKLVVSSLSSTDRLSIVAFGAISKRLLPLRRMTAGGKASARRILDTLVSSAGRSSAGDALKKGFKVLEDRREKNPAATIILLSDNAMSSSSVNRIDKVPVHSVGLDQAGTITGLLNIAVLDLQLQLGFVTGSSQSEIAAVYSVSAWPVCFGSGLVRIGNLYAEEERELLVELKVSSSSSVRAHHVLTVRCCHVDQSSTTQGFIYGREQGLLVPRPQTVRSFSSSSSIERLRCLFFSTRAVAESRRLVERSNDFAGAHHLLSTTRAMMMRSKSGDGFVSGLEAELEEVQRRRRLVVERAAAAAQPDEKAEPLTPTSAWRAAERLAKVAIMRKSMNRVSDLHGFEDARF